MYASQSWVKELVTRLFKRVISSHDTAKIDGVLYIEDIPICLTQDVVIHIDTVNGSDETGDGTETNPFASWEYVNKLLPKNFNGYNLYLYMSGIYNNTVYFTRFSNGQLLLYFVNTPTFYQLYFTQVELAYLRGSVNIDFSSCTKDNQTALFVAYCSTVYHYTGTLTVTANKTYKGRGIGCTANSAFISTNWGTEASKIVVKNCYYGIHSENLSRINIPSTYLTYSGNTTNTCLVKGGTITTAT